MRQYFGPIIRWWWMILLATILAGVGSFIIVSRMPPVYEVRSTLVIGRSVSDPNPNSGELYLEQQLATVYANIGSREQIAVATMKSLGLKALPQYFFRPVPNTPLIEITVSDTDPVRAVTVANELAYQLIQASPSGQQQTDQERQTFINDQLKKIQDQIKTTEQEVINARGKLAGLTSARQIADAQAQITALQNTLVLLQGNYANLLASSQSGAINTLALVQAAELPSSPVGPNKILYIGLATLLGLTLGVAAAYSLELLDNTYKTGDEISAAYNVPIIGYIPNINSKHRKWTYTSQFPRSPVADAFRILRTNLEFMSVSKPIRSILVIGPDLSMGKSFIATNLALIFSQGERKTILVDTDLRRPQLSSALEVTKKSGVSEVCLGRSKVQDVVTPWSNGKAPPELKPEPRIRFRKLKPVPSEIEDSEESLPERPINFVPAGAIPPNPAEILASNQFDQLLTDLVKMSDIVILDSPPLFLPDASVLLGKVDGAIMVIELGRTRKNTVKLAHDQIVRSGANLLGIVLNRVGSGESYYGEYSHYHKYGSPPG